MFDSRMSPERMKPMLKLFSRLFSLGAAASLALAGAAGYYHYTLPDSFYVTKGTELALHTALPIESAASGEAPAYAAETVPTRGSVSLRLFGIVPVKTVEVTAVDTPLVVPGGDPFGIKLLMDGVMVVGMGDVTPDGQCPAERAGIQVGDMVLSVDDTPINGNAALQLAIAAAEGESVRIRINRGGEIRTLSLTPLYSQSDGCYKAGLWVRDSTAGIGTVTYYMPDSGRFAGLGHPVCDVDTGEIIPLSSGEVVGVTIQSVIKGSAGAAGELRGCFTSGRAAGELYLNNRCGVFGTLTSPPDPAEAVPLGLKQNVHTGEAVIRTTISGTEPREYDIVIEKADWGSTGTKNMVIRITDPELLETTGGIVQGMSGSPILQDGQLIGAVTHVFVSDPTRGYGIFAENMYEYSAETGG